MKTIKPEEYKRLKDAKDAGVYANIICNTECGLGKTINFKIEGSNEVIALKCTQVGGMWSGTHCFVLA